VEQILKVRDSTEQTIKEIWEQTIKPSIPSNFMGRLEDREINVDRDANVAGGPPERRPHKAR
jgi:hypothetical protein